jgi:uncharacterized caspase-like protein
MKRILLIFFSLGISFIFTACASQVIKMPKDLPNVVKQYKSAIVRGDNPSMFNTGVHVKEGDQITFVAKGEITFWPQKAMSTGPSGPDYKLLYRTGKKAPISRYFGDSLFRVWQEGDIYLGFDDGGMTNSGVAKNPEYYRDNKGYFVVDIIVWREYDPVSISDFLEKVLLEDPNNQSLKRVSNSFRPIKEVQLVQKRANEEVEKAKEAISALKGKEVSETRPPDKKAEIPEVGQRLQEEAKAAIESLKEKENVGMVDEEKERKIADLAERLQRALQSLKNLEEMKKKLAEQEEKEKQLTARLQLLEEEKLKQPKSIPIIAILSPKDGATVESECIPLSGVAEHQRKITQFDILLNDALVGPKDQRSIKITSKELNRIEFSERVCLREGKNEITIIAQDNEGFSTKKSISVQLAKKPGETWAVIIGINKYANFVPLKYAVDDAREFYRYLVEVNKVSKDKIYLMLDQEATLDKIRSVLGTRLRRSAGKEDTVIIYWAGHGAIESDSTSVDGDGLEKYILPHNADLKDLYTSAMPMGEIARIFQRISSERLVFITDTCYSGATGGRTVPVVGVRTNISGSFLERISQGRGRVVLTASDANEVTVESDDLRHGVFTYYLLEGLRGKADLDGNGIITVDEVYRYVSIKVPQATGQEQHPVRKGEMIGEIILGVLK